MNGGDGGEQTVVLRSGNVVLTCSSWLLSVARMERGRGRGQGRSTGAETEQSACVRWGEGGQVRAKADGERS
jgi:hypothetical protein